MRVYVLTETADYKDGKDIYTLGVYSTKALGLEQKHKLEKEEELRVSTKDDVMVDYTYHLEEHTLDLTTF